MAMTPKGWSISALATEFGMDRRTIALRIRDVKPIGEVNGNDVWRLADVVDAILKRSTSKHAPERAPAPPGFAELDRLDDPFDQGAMAMALALLYRVGNLAASMSAGCGAPMKVAYAMEGAMTLVTMQAVNEIGKSFGLANFRVEEDPPYLQPEFFAPTNWEGLAAAKGEPVDLDAWKAYSATVMNEPESEAA